MGVIGVVVQPVLVGAAVRLGWVGLFVLTVAGQAVVVTADRVGSSSRHARRLLDGAGGVDRRRAHQHRAGLVRPVPGRRRCWWGGLVASSRRRPAELSDPDVDGVVFVQLDGVPFPVLQMAITAGTVPTLTRWVRSGTHELREWTPKLPATTPASQMGILHGVIDGIPAFRWYDRARDRILVANRPADAAVIEGDLTDRPWPARRRRCQHQQPVHRRRADGGPDDEPARARRRDRPAGGRRVRGPPGRPRPGPSPGRSSELARDRFQARRAIRRDVQPRCDRTWETAAAALRHQRGAARPQHDPRRPAHAARHPLDLRRLRGLRRDRPPRRHPAARERWRRSSPSTGPPPAGARGHGGAAEVPLRDPVRPRAGAGNSCSPTGTARTWPPSWPGSRAATSRPRTTTSRAGAGRARWSASSRPTSGVTGRSMQSASDADGQAGSQRPRRCHPPLRHDGVERPGEGEGHSGRRRDLPRLRLGEPRPDLRPRREGAARPAVRSHERFPGLVDGLASASRHRVRRRAGRRRPGRLGQPRLAPARRRPRRGRGPAPPVRSRTPLPFVQRVAHRPEAPDIYVNSLVDPGTEEVAAFEGLVGCHGGLGGWQDRASIVFPTDLPFPRERVVGADAMHLALRSILRHLGHRADIADEDADEHRAPTA